MISRLQSLTARRAAFFAVLALIVVVAVVSAFVAPLVAAVAAPAAVALALVARPSTAEPRQRLERRAIEDGRRVDDHVVGDSAAQLQSALDGMRDGVAVVDRDGRLVLFNRSLFEVLGYPREAAAAVRAGDPALQHVTAFVHPDDLQRHLRTPGPDARYRISATRRDGRPIELDVTVAGIGVGEGGGESNGVIFEIRDVTEESALEQQIESATAEVRSILETAPDPIIVVDGRGCILRVNWAVTTVFGWEPEELIGQSIGVLGDSPESGERLAFLQHVLGTGREGRRGGTTETVARTRDGMELTIELSVAEMRNVAERGGEGAGRFICVLHDVTEQRRSREQLLYAQKNEALGTLVSGVAHDFNNLLTLIAGNLELAREADEIDPHWIETACYATDNAIDLVKQLLLFSRREEASMGPVDISRLVEDTVELMRATIDRRIELRVFAPETVPAVEGDRGQLHQVLMNLLVNARDTVLARIESATVPPDYRPYIAISVVLGEAEDAHGVTRQCVAMAVEDNGMGMTPKVRERVFDPFFTTKGVGEGTGLGLSTTYGIVTEHNGTMSVESRLGDGATFNVVLPTMAEQPAAAERPEQPAAARGASQRRASVLLVDDDERIVTLTGLMLTRAGFDVTMVTGGDEALTAAAERDFDLVVLDVNMPAPNGWETLDGLLKEHPTLRVLMASGFASEAEAREHGAVGLIDKPFHSKDLIEAVERSLVA